MAGDIINSGTRIGAHSIVNSGAIVEHDCAIESYTHICPHSTICGKSRIENSVWIGAGCTVIHDITVCDNVTLGAGTVVIKNLEIYGTYNGVPARRRIMEKYGMWGVIPPFKKRNQYSFLINVKEGVLAA